MPLDPVTFEVLRHRLWAINDEQGLVAARISGSPVVYEAFDFNTALLTPEGEGLFVGIYGTRLSASIYLAVKAIIERFSENPGIEDGDAFLTNDPWFGAVHMNDYLMCSPIFWKGKLVCWTGVTMHEIDVGGPVPGSFVVGSREVFGEAPLVPPVKIVEKGTMRKDIEALVLRNSRTAPLNALNLRARLAAMKTTRERVFELIEQYGVETFLEVQSEILRYVEKSVRRKLEKLPDGVWYERGIIDHDGNENRFYPLQVAMQKQGDHLTFDFRGSSPQAPGMVNCTRSGLEGGVLSALLPTLCADVPWSPGGLKNLVTIVAEPGTINCAEYPAAVSMATVSAAYATGNLAASTLSKMFACSPDFQEEVQANWCPGWNGHILSGTNRWGNPFTATLIDQAGGGGARSWKDGIDSGGPAGSPARAISNVETAERLYPILYVYRRHRADTGGPGKFRGGVGTEQMKILHKARGSLRSIVVSQGCSQPEAKGLFGGYPSSIQGNLVLRKTNIAEIFQRGRIPAEITELSSAGLEVLAAKDSCWLEPGDVFVSFSAGGGGYGDPLERDPQRVFMDVQRELCSPEVARDVYGVLWDDVGMKVDEEGTERRRHELRLERLDSVRGALKTAQFESPEPARKNRADRSSQPIADCLQLVRSREASELCCQRCGYLYGPAREDPKRRAAWREVPISGFSPLNRYSPVGDFVICQSFCPRCGLLLAASPQRAGDLPAPDMELG